jgi:hypothetical protein
MLVEGPLLTGHTSEQPQPINRLLRPGHDECLDVIEAPADLSADESTLLHGELTPDARRGRALLDGVAKPGRRLPLRADCAV